MPIMAAAAVGAAGAGVSAIIGGLFGRSSNRAAQNAQNSANDVQRQQIAAQTALQSRALDFQQRQADIANAAQDRQFNFAQEQRDYLRNTVRPEMQRTQTALQTSADGYANTFDTQANTAYDRGNTFFNRAEQYAPQLNEQLYGLITNTGDQTYGIQAANRAAADTGQAYSRNQQANLRMGRAYGGDINRLLANQADNDPMAALAQASAMDKARNVARQLKIGEVAGGIDQFGKNYALADNQTRLGLSTNQGAMAMRTAPATFGLQAAQIQSGLAGQVGNLYTGGAQIAGSNLSTAGSGLNAASNYGSNLLNSSFNNANNLSQAAALNNAGIGNFIGQNVFPAMNRGFQQAIPSMINAYDARVSLPTSTQMQGYNADAAFQTSTGNGVVW
jgi:hypothetical protein